MREQNNQDTTKHDKNKRNILDLLKTCAHEMVIQTIKILQKNLLQDF